MSALFLALVTVLITHPTEGRIVKRDTCAQLIGEQESCDMRAYAAFTEAVTKGDDGRPNWMARKACNYITSSVDHCGNLLLGDCYSLQEVTDMKDQQLPEIVSKLEQMNIAWDSRKCPVVKAHILRTKGEIEEEEEAPAKVEEDKSCSPKLFEACTREAYETFNKKIQAGPDGRPDWLARKSCNYMTEAVDECGNMLVGTCNTEEEVLVMKDYQYEGILNQLATKVKEWDSEKCPAVKAYVERQNTGRFDASLSEETSGGLSEDAFQVLATVIRTGVDVLYLINTMF